MAVAKKAMITTIVEFLFLVPVACIGFFLLVYSAGKKIKGFSAFVKKIWMAVHRSGHPCCFMAFIAIAVVALARKLCSPVFSGTAFGTFWFDAFFLYTEGG